MLRVGIPRAEFIRKGYEHTQLAWSNYMRRNKVGYGSPPKPPNSGLAFQAIRAAAPRVAQILRPISQPNSAKRLR